MSMIKVKEKELIICKKIKKAESIEDRMIGLMFRKSIHEGFDGLLLNPCKSIHTFFMRFPIDVLFLNRELKVVKIIKNLKPWRITGLYFRADQVLEMSIGSIPESLKIGDELEIICIK